MPVTARKNTLLLIIIVSLSALCFWQMFHDGIAWSDFPVQWRVCAYTLRGIDIYTLRASNDFLPEIGEIGAGFHASPWGSILENIFYGGFLPFEAAKIYFIIINIAVLCMASYVLWIKAKCISLDFAACALILSFLSVDFMVSVHEGNAGGVNIPTAKGGSFR